MNHKHDANLLFFISIFSGMALGLLLMLISGYNPLILIQSMIRGATGIDFAALARGGRLFNARYVGEFFVSVMPLWMTGLAVAFAFRAGLFNIGAEGQIIAASAASSVAALCFPPIAGLHFVVVIASGVLMGMLWGLIPGVLKAVFQAHEVVVTIMLNYIALYGANFIIRSLPDSVNTKTALFPQSALLHSEFLSALTNNSRLHWGIGVSVVAFIVFYVIAERTTLGFTLKATGGNPFAARHAGMHVKRNIVLSMAISGGFAGLAGVFITIGTYNYGRILIAFENFGFNGIAVALLGNNNALGVLYSGLLFGSLQAAQPIMQVQRVSKDITIIVIASIIFFIAMKRGLQDALAYHRIKRMHRGTGGSK